MKVRLCGVRGSTPAPGASFVRVGGHTSCVAVTPDGEVHPRLLLDAGTGIRSVDDLLDGRAFAGTILLTHLHWDHTQGLPFFRSGDRDDAVVRVLVPSDGVDAAALDAAALLSGAMSPPHFPIGPDGLAGAWTFDPVVVGRHVHEGIVVRSAEVPHKGGLTFGYRLEDRLGSFAHLPDHLAACGSAAALGLARGADVLVHDAQFDAAQSSLAHRYGHSTVDEAVDLATSAGVGELVLFHHSPSSTDDDLDALVDRARRSAGPRLRVTLGIEGLELEPRSS